MASDHAGINLRLELAAELRDAGHIVHDLGPEAAERVDYPDFAEKLARAMKPVADASGGLASGVLAHGVLVCGSGIGISIAANRFPWIRCALCHDVTTARLSREHNNANVIALGERLTGPTTASDAVKAFLATEFEGGRHAGRVDKLSALNT